MKFLSPIIVCLFMFGISFSAFSVTNVEIAKAYIQAVTGGTGSKVAGTINYETLGCTPATVFDANKCQKIVFNGKDGKTILIETITAANVAQLVPLEDVRRAYQYYDATYDNVRLLFNLLSTRGSSWFPELDGNGNTKHILQKHFESTGAGGMYGNFEWPFDSAGPETAKMTAAGVDFYIHTLPTADTPDVNHAPFYFWSLQTDFSEMAYPQGFVFPPNFKFPDPNNPGLCQDTTTSWGHVGLQYLNNHSLANVPDVRQVNWGGAVTVPVFRITAAAAAMYPSSTGKRVSGTNIRCCVVHNSALNCGIGMARSPEKEQQHRFIPTRSTAANTLRAQLLGSNPSALTAPTLN